MKKRYGHTDILLLALLKWVDKAPRVFSPSKYIVSCADLTPLSLLFDSTNVSYCIGRTCDDGQQQRDRSAPMASQPPFFLFYFNTQSQQ